MDLKNGKVRKRTKRAVTCPFSAKKRPKFMQFKDGSRAVKIIDVLMVAREFPMRSIHLFGSRSLTYKIIETLTGDVKMRFADGEVIELNKIISVRGNYPNRSVRLLSNSLPLLKKVVPDEGYIDRLLSDMGRDTGHIKRRYKIAEAVAMCYLAGVEVRPYKLPSFQYDRMEKTVSDDPSLYLLKSYQSKEKEIRFGDNRIKFTKVVGVLFSGGKCYAVYNSRYTEMKWLGIGELKTKEFISRICALNYDSRIGKVDSAIIFYETDEVVYGAVEEMREYGKFGYVMNKVFYNDHFIKLDGNGIRQLRIMTEFRVHERINEELFGVGIVNTQDSGTDYDLFYNGNCYLSFLDGNITKLIRFINLISKSGELKGTVICFDFQTEMVKRFTGNGCMIMELDIGTLERRLGIENKEVKSED